MTAKVMASLKFFGNLPALISLSAPEMTVL